MKNIKDLKKAVSDFDKLKYFLSKYKNIVDSGRLSEFWCARLFNLELSEKTNDKIDAIDRNGKRIEIKQRFYTGKVPIGMKIKLNSVDEVYYVQLGLDLIPQEIYKIEARNIESLKNSRVSFKKAFLEKRAEVVFRK